MVIHDIDLLIDFNIQRFEKQDYPLLYNLRQHWSRDKPLAGVNILHNIPLTFETAVKLESLIAAGANLTVTHTQFAPFPAKQEVVQLLAAMGITYIAKHKTIKGEYDIALDCCAELFALTDVKIKKGLVELTQSGARRIKQSDLTIPVINVDDSYLKNLECMYGTGEACLRALQSMIPEALNNQYFTIFGFGKVGKGIARYLSSISKYITIIDTCERALSSAKAQGFNVIDIGDKPNVEQALKESFCIVCATGQAGLLECNFTKEQLNHAYVANMGADDEIGDLRMSKLLFDGMAINFSLENPTLMHFIDPIFYAHNIAAQLLVEHEFKPGYHRFPKSLDTLIIDYFTKYHALEVDDIFQT
jgi:adenosylhomocysteinase